MIQALVFDFDGLILETEAPIYQSWQEIYQQYGYQLSFEKWVTIIGTAEGEIGYDPLTELEAHTGLLKDREKIIHDRREREMDIILSQSVLPGVQEYLHDAQRLGLKVGVASSSPCEWVTGHLKRLALIEYFDCIKAADDVPRTKPDPAVYLAVLECLGAPPHFALALEDSSIGSLAAVRAGMFCAVVPTAMTRGMNFDHAHMRLDSLTDMPLEALITKIETMSHN